MEANHETIEETKLLQIVMWDIRAQLLTMNSNAINGLIIATMTKQTKLQKKNMIPKQNVKMVEIPHEKWTSKHELN